MSQRSWTDREEQLLRENYVGIPNQELASLLNRSVSAVKSRAQRLGVTRSLRFTSEDDRIILRDYRQCGCRAVAEILGRNVDSVYRRAFRLGITTPRAFASDQEIEESLRELHPQGFSDREIADRLGNTERHRVGDIRQRLGLPSNANSERRRRLVGEKTQLQLAEAGVDSLAEVRALAFRDYAKRNGWPEDLRPRSVQILNALYDNGPQTRRQLCDVVGMPWKGSRKSLASNDPEGSYLANLQARGLVVRLGRVVKGRGRGHSTNLYAVPTTIKRGDATTWPQETTDSSIREHRLPRKKPTKRNCELPCSTE